MNVGLSKLTFAGLCGTSPGVLFLRQVAGRCLRLGPTSIARESVHPGWPGRGLNTLSYGIFGQYPLARSRPPSSFFTSCLPDAIAATSRPSPILQFIISKTSFATHRSGSRSYRYSGGNGYPPPQGPLRRVVDALPGSFIIWGILGINIAVWGVWMVAIANAKQGQPTIYIRMMKHFSQNAQNLREGRYWTLLTSCLSHQGVTHILFNSIAFYSIAPTVIAALGNTRFLGFYLASGVISNVFSEYWHSYVRPDPKYASLGASGAVSAVIAFLTCLNPHTTFLLFGVVPMPAYVLVGGLLAYDGYNTWFDAKNGVDAAAHVGGLAAGFAYFFRRRFGIRM